MKKGWQTKSLGELCRFIDYRGRTPNKTESGLRLITAKNVKMGFLQTNPLEYVHPDIYESWMTRGIPKVGDVIFTTEAPLANVAQLDTDERVVFAQRIIVLQPVESNLDRTFLKYLLLSDRTQQRIHEKGTGATVKGIKASLLKDVDVGFPPLPEQQRIVGILDEAFEGIATATANAEKNLQNARALFESQLEASFTQRSDSFSRVPLSQILSRQPRNGWSPPAEFQTGSGYPVLTLSAVTGFEYDGTRVKMSSAPVRHGAHYWLETGELLMTRSNTPALVGHVAIFDGKPARAICPDLIMKMKVNEAKADTRFVYFALRTRSARNYITSRAQGASPSLPRSSWTPQATNGFKGGYRRGVCMTYVGCESMWRLRPRTSMISFWSSSVLESLDRTNGALAAGGAG